MGGLTLTLRPGERFLVGGLLLENGPKRSSVTVKDEDVFVLRLSDAIRPDQAQTPVRRAYHAAQRILACEVTVKEGRAPLLDLLADLKGALAGTALEETVLRAQEAAETGRYHGTLAALKTLFTIEDALLSPGEARARVAR